LGIQQTTTLVDTKLHGYVEADLHVLKWAQQQKLPQKYRIAVAAQ